MICLRLKYLNQSIRLTAFIKCQENGMDNADSERKPYTKPEIVHELELETRAGSPLSLPEDPLKVPGSVP